VSERYVHDMVRTLLELEKIDWQRAERLALIWGVWHPFNMAERDYA
jgi:hypothetical protein